MSQYMLTLQRAISQTDVKENTNIDYHVGWHEAGLDLTYGVSCGSEHAVQAQMAAWLIEPNNPYYETLDSQSDKGYCERVRAINNLMENME